MTKYYSSTMTPDCLVYLSTVESCCIRRHNIACVQTLQCEGAKRRGKLPVESAQRRPILCFEFSDFMEPSVIGCTIQPLFLIVFSVIYVQQTLF